MSNNSIDYAETALFQSSRRTRNIKFYFLDGATGEQLSDYRNRVIAQIESGIAQENTVLDSDLLD